MITLIIFCVLVGATVGLRFPVYILVPVIVMAIFFVAVIAVAQGNQVWAIIFAVLPSVVSLEVGYLCGSFACFILEDLRRRRYAFSPLAAATDRSIDKRLATSPDLLLRVTNR
jgi:hypothetical protein